MIQLAKIFQNGMILQRDKPVQIWGTTDQSQRIQICVDSEMCIEADIEAGDFECYLPPMPAGENQIVSILGSAGDEIHLKNVDFGEIWIAGGQSNMEFFLRYDEEGKKTIKTANDEHLRYYNVAQYAFEGEEKDGFKDASRWEAWYPFYPEYVETFSAAGIYFAKELRAKYGVPVGIIGCNWGGTTASAWMDEKLLEEDKDLRIFIDEYAEKTKDLDLKAYVEANHAARTPSPIVQKVTRYLMEGSHKLLLKSLEPVISSFPPPQMGPYSENRPGGLYKTMVSKIKGFGCRGVLWYQGESDDEHASLYGALFTKMIQCWRRDWKDEIPFLFVQLAPFRKWCSVTAMNYPVLRQQQELVSKTVPNTWMASIMDIGMELDIHPKKKRPVGERLALLARGKIYGEEILCEAPELEWAEKEDGAIYLHFKNAGNGLELKNGPLSSMKVFIGGQEIEKVTSAIDRNILILKSDKLDVTKEIEIRFAMEQYCVVNLYSSIGLPAKPFQCTI